MVINWREEGKLEKYLSQDSQCCNQDSNQTPPEYTSRILPLYQLVWQNIKRIERKFNYYNLICYLFFMYYCV
jgi:hypothetical protein